MRGLCCLCTLIWTTTTCALHCAACPLQGNCHTTDAPYRMFSTRTPYDEVRGDASSHPDIAGCSAKQVYMLVRHGTRYPASDEVELMQQFLPVITQYILVPNNTGCLSTAQKKTLQTWKLPFHADDDLRIAEQGLREMHDIAFRMRKRLPKIMKLSKEDMGRVNIRCTDHYRSLISAKHFLSGLLPNNISVGQHGETDVGETTPESQDKLLLYSDICYKYIRQRLYKHETEKDETAKFDEGEDIQQAMHDVSRHLGLPPGFMNLTVMRGLYEACRYGYAIFKDSTWCDVLPVSMLKVMEYRQDMRYYWRYGHGREVNYEPSCLLLQDVWNSFRAVTSGSRHADKVVLRFGHSRSILPFLVRLGYFNDSVALLADNFKLHKHRQWQLAKVNPFSSNVAFTLYKCQDNLYRVETLVNEHQVSPIACQDVLCPLSDLQNTWHSILDQCDFEKICDQDRAKDIDLSSLNKNQFHHA